MGFPGRPDGERATTHRAWAAAAGADAGLRLRGLAGVTVLATNVALTDWDSPVRTVLVLLYLLLVPGLAVTEALAIRDPLQRLALAVGISLAGETLVALALLYAGAFTPDATTAAVGGLTCVVLAGAAALERRDGARRAARAEGELPAT